MNAKTINKTITFDGSDYAIDKLSKEAKSQIANIQFSDKQLLQLENELAVSNTARNGYLKALKAEVTQSKKAGS